MILHTPAQGSPEWLAHRAKFFNASDAPAMLGCSAYKTRDQLLHEMHTGLTAEVDAGTQRLFDDGHRFEALARPVAEAIIGQGLYPVVGSEGKLSASFDGLTIDDSIAFEHKTMNAALYGDGGPWGDDFEIPLQYRIQMEQQCLVSGCEKVLFMASRWNDDELDVAQHCWYKPDFALRAKIIAGWEQFEKDLAAFVPQVTKADAVGHTPETLPALRIEVSGMVTASNLAQYKEHALAVFGGINRELTTDQHFADAEKAVKWCADVESRLEAAKEHALSQTASIDQLFKAIDDISAEARRTRLELDKLVKARKEELRADIVCSAREKFIAHVDALNMRLGRKLMPDMPIDLAGAIKGKKSLDSMRSAVSTMLANSKIEANAVAERIQINLETKGLHGYATLFPDIATLCLKAADDFQNTVTARITHHEAAEAAKAEQAARANADAIQAAQSAQVAAEAAKVARIATAPAVEYTLPTAPPSHQTVITTVSNTVSAMRQAVNEHLSALSDDELERVLRFLQSRYPLQAKAA